MKSDGTAAYESFFFMRCIIFIVVVPIFLYGCSQPWNQETVDELTSIVNNSDVENIMPYINNKIIVIENNKKLEEYVFDNEKKYSFSKNFENSCISDVILGKINKKLIAKNKKEAKTIIIINWEERETGKKYKATVSKMLTGEKEIIYISGYIVVANVKIYDVYKKITISDEEILGASPRDSFMIIGNIDHNTINRGEIPFDDVVNYINRLKVVK